MRRRLSLRARLVLGVVVLATVGLVAADAATYILLRSSLLHRVDRTLESEHFGVHGPGPGDGRGLPPGDFFQVRSLSGAVLNEGQGPPFGNGEEPSPPRLPAKISVPTRSTGGEPTHYFTVRSQDGSLRYRVRASYERNDNEIVIVGTPLTSVDSTLNRLLWIELLVTGLVLAALAALGMWVVRLGLRPLAAIGRTAAAIAEGDLSQRVQRAEERTEVGRLGLALNAMLGQIERAFKAQAASEQRLRRFVADASHELRTPLAAVRAYAELFTRGADRRPDDLARSMTGITRESERMSLLVDDLLLLARLDEGLPLEREPV